MPAPVLTLAHLRKDFGATRALVDARLDLYPGEVTALLGENGAGKSTLVKILAGLHRPDGGEIRLDSQVVSIDSPADARRLGISIVHQESVLFDNLSVAENILIHARPLRRGFIDWSELRRRALTTLAQLEARFDPDQLVGELSSGQKQLVQIARGLSHHARIVVLDEPTAALSHREAEDLGRIVNRLKATGTALLFISHRLEEIRAWADRYTVFRDGSAVGDGKVAEATSDALIRLMVGRDPPRGAVATEGTSPCATAPPLLHVDHLSRAPSFRDVSFDAWPGEILGVYGLVGAGRTELMQCLFGLIRADSGRVTFEGHEVRIRTPQDAIRLGIAYLPEDRQRHGAILPFSIAANLALPNLAELSSGGFQSSRRTTQFAQRWMTELQIKASGPARLVQDLSGGNQQKVVLAKWLATQPKVLILDEPTRGIDVGAKAAVHEIIRSLAAQGVAIVMVSSDLPEVLQMSHRVIVMRQGTVCARLTGAQSSAENLAQAATGL